MDNPFERSLMESLEGRGWWIRPKLEFEEFWDLLVQRGGWYDPFVDFDHWERACGHPDRKIRLFVPGLGGREGDDLASVPHHEVPELVMDVDYPFTLVPFRMARIDGGTSGWIPWVIESSGPAARLLWGSWVELSPAGEVKAGGGGGGEG